MLAQATGAHAPVSASLSPGWDGTLLMERLYRLTVLCSWTATWLWRCWHRQPVHTHLFRQDYRLSGELLVGGCTGFQCSLTFCYSQPRAGQAGTFYRCIQPCFGWTSTGLRCTCVHLFPSVYRLAGTSLHKLTVQSDLLPPRCNTAQHRLPVHTHLYRSNCRLVAKLLLMGS